ncbi:hypothetical protein SNE40_005867 [Patella caerulea]|uniref:Dynein light chain n=1 Tax=Patella caerulea TaxID=87958 RepID=A0AAN8K2I4_PATCE
MTNGNEEDTVANLPTPTESLVPPKSPRKVSIASNVFARRISTQPSEDGAASSSGKMDLSALMRRRSTFKGLAQSITNAIAIRRLTKASVDLSQKPKQKLENTYKMNPDEGKGFYPDRMRKAITEVLETNLDEVTYSAKNAGILAENLTEMIKSRIKLLKLDRYKIVCNVILGQCLEQGLESASRCVWDQKVDNYACVTYKNKTLFVVATVYGIYFE